MGQPHETRINTDAVLSGAGQLNRIATDFDTAWADGAERGPDGV